MRNEIILHQTPLEDLKGILSEIVSEAVSKQVSEQFAMRNIREEKEFDFLTRYETAKKLNISLPTLNQWTKDGKIRGARIGSRVRYRMTDVEAALKNIITKRR